jgi:tRNA (guanine-N7-)-methyltransferase
MEFLEKYKSILQENGIVHLKTDSEFMHGYTLGLLQGLGIDILYANHDVYRNEGSPKEVLEIQTFYENQYLESGKPITYLKFRIASV